MTDHETKSIEEELRAQKISVMVGMIEQLGQDNGSGDQYLTAITICAGRYIKRMPMSMRQKVLHQFLQTVRHYTGERSDAN